MLTKEECLKALCRIQCGAKIDCNECECYDTKINIWKCVENTKESLVIRQLINEHFDDSPLKFEDLKDGMCIWDNKEKKLILLRVWIEDNKKKIQYIDFGDDKYHWLRFEENRFYDDVKE